jgi:hypothetical protein
MGQTGPLQIVVRQSGQGDPDPQTWIRLGDLDGACPEKAKAAWQYIRAHATYKQFPREPLLTNSLHDSV